MTSKKTSRKMNNLKISAEDIELFRNAVKTSTPIKNESNQPYKNKPKPKAIHSRQDNKEVLIESLESDVEIQELNTTDSLKFYRSGINKKNFKKLARGSYSTQAELDLHGMTINEASKELKLFINHCVNNGYTCVRIIHGKGLGSGGKGPVLKQEVNRLLRRWKQVLAFVSARQIDGGTGAIYVLLKKD